jgi:hypothetical protein
MVQKWRSMLRHYNGLRQFPRLCPGELWQGGLDIGLAEVLTFE